MKRSIKIIENLLLSLVKAVFSVLSVTKELLSFFFDAIYLLFVYSIGTAFGMETEQDKEKKKMDSCFYYSGSDRLKCAVNPKTPCLGCRHYYPKE